MSDFTFIRHAETDMAGTFCGHSDPPVNAAGRLQIAGLIGRLQTERFEAIYSSDLQRTMMTANGLASAFAVPCLPRTGLREIHFGAWEGLSWDAIEQRDKTYAQSWVDSYPDLPAPEGELFSDFESRIQFELLSLLEHQCGPLAVVTHAGVLRSVLKRVCACDEQQAQNQTKAYCSFFRVPEKTMQRWAVSR